MTTQPSTSKGIWTPTLVFATPAASSFVYTAQQGQFTYNSGLVQIDLSLTFTPTIGGASGNLQIQGLPFPVNVSGGFAGALARMTGAGWATLPAAPLFFKTIDPANIVLCSMSGIVSTNLLATNCTDGNAAHSVQGSLVYPTNT